MMLDFLHGAMQVLSQVGQAAADGPAAVVSAAGTLQTVADTTAQASGILHFISRSDVVGKSLFGILLAMSLISWYLIFVKIFMTVRNRRRSPKFFHAFLAASSL